MKKLLYGSLLLLAAQSVSAETVQVPGGVFLMGCSAEDRRCDADEGPRGGVPVYVDTFKIDVNETSVAEYRACVEDGACERPFDNERNKYCNYDGPGKDNHPLNCVDWTQAVDYCRWKGGRLAYEAEWEKAARAGSNDRYPWGNENADCSRAIMDDGRTTATAGDETDGCGTDHTWERASRAPNALGLFDMHGGVAEWVQNRHAEDSHQRLYAQGDIEGPAEGTRRVIRGGAWDEGFRAQTNSSRWSKIPTGHVTLYGSNGIRCAYDVK